MSSAHRGGNHRRRVRIAVPAAVTTLLLGGAGAFLAAPAHASADPVMSLSAGHHPAGQAQLKARVAAAHQGGHFDTVAPARPKSAGSASTSPTPHQVEPDIIGGTPADFSTAPWMVQLWYTDPSTGDGFFCGGTLVTPSKILTAAHCVSGDDWADNGAVVSGTAQLPTFDSDGNVTSLNGGTVSAVAHQWSDPSFSEATTDNDVAVLTLDTPIAGKTLPITDQNDTASYTPGTQATLYGWGRTTSTSDDISPTLQTATLPIDADSDCGGYYGTDFVPGHMTCVGDPASGSDAGTVSACNGDSGGPLVVGGRIVGVVSWGVQDCVAQGAYSVFSKVGAYATAIDPRLDDADMTGDGLADMVARTPAGTAYAYPSTGKGFAAREQLADKWSYSPIVKSDLDRDSIQDFLMRSSTGVLWWRHINPANGAIVDTDIGGGWNSMKVITSPGDLTGDGLPDVFAVDTSGKVWIYPGNGKGGFGARKQAGYGWNIYGANVFGHGDFTADGHDDIMARDSSGNLWLYKGTGSATAPLAARVKIGYGYSYTAYVTDGDSTGDGKADLVARDSSGNLWLYKGTGSATAPLAARVKIGYGYNIYSVFS